MEWVELILNVGDPDLADEIAALLVDAGGIAAQGAHVRGGEVVIWAPAPEATAAADAMRAEVARLAEAGLAVDPANVTTRPAPPESEWRDAWKKFFHVKRVTKSIVIVPSWETYAAQPGDVVLDLDPGRAFGTGAHASTRLCLVELEQLRAEGLMPKTWLDVGTGSGILAVAAAKLWPSSTGVAMDDDPQAVDYAHENLEKNHVTDRVRTTTDVLDVIGGAHQLVLANIQADVLLMLRDALCARVAPGGSLVLAGLLTAQGDPVATAFEQAGLRRVRLTELDDDHDWIAVVLRRA